MVISALKTVFINARYAVLASIASFAVFVLSTWLANLRLVRQIAFSPSIATGDKLNILASLIGSIRTNFSVFSASYTVAIALLFGINLAMIAYYIKQRKTIAGQSGVAAGAGGLISGMFGIGCAACGTLVLGPLLTLIGAGGLIAFLPLAGAEFGIASVGILSWSIFLIARKIKTPLICKSNLPNCPDSGQTAKPKSQKK